MTLTLDDLDLSRASFSAAPAIETQKKSPALTLAQARVLAALYRGLAPRCGKNPQAVAEALTILMADGTSSKRMSLTRTWAVMTSTG